MSYQNGASSGSGYQPIESSLSNGGKSGVAARVAVRESKRCEWCRSIFWEVHTPPMRIESNLDGWISHLLKFGATDDLST